MCRIDRPPPSGMRGSLAIAARSLPAALIAQVQGAGDRLAGGHAGEEVGNRPDHIKRVWANASPASFRRSSIYVVQPLPPALGEDLAILRRALDAIVVKSMSSFAAARTIVRPADVSTCSIASSLVTPGLRTFGSLEGIKIDDDQLDREDAVLGHRLPCLRGCHQPHGRGCRRGLLGWSVLSRPCGIISKAGVIGHVADGDALAFTASVHHASRRC